MEITIQKDQRLVIRGSVSGQIWCEECGTQTESVNLAMAGTVAEALSIQFGLQLLPGLHMLQDQDGSSRICLASLFEQVRKAGGTLGSGLERKSNT